MNGNTPSGATIDEAANDKRRNNQLNDKRTIDQEIKDKSKSPKTDEGKRKGSDEEYTDEFGNSDGDSLDNARLQQSMSNSGSDSRKL